MMKHLAMIPRKDKRELLRKSAVFGGRIWVAYDADRQISHPTALPDGVYIILDGDPFFQGTQELVDWPILPEMLPVAKLRVNRSNWMAIKDALAGPKDHVILNGVEARTNGALTATDRHRLHRATCEVLLAAPDGDESAILPEAFLKLAFRLARNNVQVCWGAETPNGDRILHGETDTGYRLDWRTTPGVFPNWERVLPKSLPGEMCLAQEIKAALLGVRSLAQEGGNRIVLYRGKDERLHFWASVEGIGERETSCSIAPCSALEPPTCIVMPMQKGRAEEDAFPDGMAFNVDYLLDAVVAAQSPLVRMGFPEEDPNRFAKPLGVAAA